MDESTSQKPSQQEHQRGVLLTENTSNEFDAFKCIICQKHDKKEKTSHPSEAGRRSMKRAADIRNDIVTKRLKRAEEGAISYVYHNNNKCFKWYTHSKKLKQIEDDVKTLTSDAETSCEAENETSSSMLHRSDVRPRERPSQRKDPKLIKCTVCGSERIKVNQVILREKF